MPAITELNVMDQGAENFPWVAGWVDNLVITANTPVSYDVNGARSAMGLHAGQALFLCIAGDAPYWANFTGGTPSVPPSTTTDGSGSEFQPNQRYLDENVTTITFNSGVGANLSLAFYRP